MRRLLLVPLAVFALGAPAAGAKVAERPWPPAEGPGTLFAHFGEEHINDADGGTLLPKVVQESARYRPRLVTTSGDKANDGVPEQFELWQAAMKHFDDAGIPYLAGAGNHDRTSPPGVPGGTAGLFGATTPDSFDVYKAFFAGRPYPWGDAPPYEGIATTRPADDPAGAAATYVADVGDVRWIFLDNSCWGLSGCDQFVARAEGGTEPQLEFLASRAKEATDAGKTVFVVMHIPTRDPRDQDYTDFTARQHIMGKGVTTTDNRRFEEIAAANGVDGVFVGHIKGQFLYAADGVPYYIDGGAGGELYTEGPVGTDHGYWHGFRLVRVDGGRITTDAVPIFVEGGLRIDGPATVRRGTTEAFQGFGRQPVFNDPAKVEALELRDPAPTPKGGAARAELLGIPLGDLAYGAPVLLLLVLVPLAGAAGPRRRLALAGGGLALLGAGGVGTMAVAQQSEPTSTPREALPVPARIWTTSDARILRPVAAEGDDPRRDPATQTEDGRFEGVCPGRATLSLTSGFEQEDRQVVVPSEPGRILRSVTRKRRLRAGKVQQVARVRLSQPAVVSVTVRRGGKVVARKRAACVTSGSQVLRWSARNVRAGRYTLEVRASSDRKPSIARYRLTVVR